MMLTGAAGSDSGGGPFVRSRGGRPSSVVSVGVDPFQRLPAADDRDDPPEGLLVPEGAVFAAFQRAVAFDPRPGVEAAVRLAERPDVGGQAVGREEAVQLQQVVVAGAERDLLGGDDLFQRLGVLGRDRDDRPRLRFAPPFVGLVDAVAPAEEGLHQRRVLAGQFGEGVELFGRATVGDAEQDVGLRRHQGHRGAGGGGEEERPGLSPRGRARWSYAAASTSPILRGSTPRACASAVPRSLTIATSISSASSQVAKTASPKTARRPPGSP